MGKPKEAGEDQVDGSDVPFWISTRMGLALLAFFAFIGNYAQRVGMSVAIVCMVNQTAIYDLSLPQVTGNVSTVGTWDNMTSTLAPVIDTCVKHNANGSDPAEDGPFVWEKPIQGHILGSFFYGYLVSQIPAGLLAERYGPKWVFGISIALATVATLLSPVAAQISYIFLIILRVILGAASGAIFPAMHTMWGRWAPPMERSKLTGISYAGAMMGNVVALPLSGFLCHNGFNGGWPSVFYVIGIGSTVTVILWMALVSNSPAAHPRISSKERKYITSSLEGQVVTDDSNEKSFPPWKKVLTSPAVWAIIVANFCSDWGLYTLLTNIPTFLKEVLYFDIQSNGWFSALPFLGLWANMNISPMICDKLRSSGVLSTTVVRKIFNSVGLVGAAVSLVALSFMNCHQTALSIVLLTLGVTLSGCAYSGFLVNHMDIAPRFAGTLFGMSNGMGAISGFVAPYVAAVLTENGTREEWQRVFYLAAAVYLVGAVVYAVLGSGALQPWALEEEPSVGYKVSDNNGAPTVTASDGLLSSKDEDNVV